MQERPDTHHSRRDTEPTGERKVLTLRLLTDREVPLPSAVSASIGDMPNAVHQWLDGEVSERAAVRADVNNVDFWNRINTETSRRSRMATPALMSERIMAVLPPKKPSRLQTLFKSFHVTPLTAAAAAAGLLAAGAYVGKMFLR